MSSTEKDIMSLVESVVNDNGDSDKHLMTLFSIALSIKAKKILALRSN